MDGSSDFSVERLKGKVYCYQVLTVNNGDEIYWVATSSMLENFLSYVIDVTLGEVYEKRMGLVWTVEEFRTPLTKIPKE